MFDVSYEGWRLLLSRMYEWGQKPPPDYDLTQPSFIFIPNLILPYLIP